MAWFPARRQIGGERWKIFQLLVRSSSWLQPGAPVDISKSHHPLMNSRLTACPCAIHLDCRDSF